MAGTQQKYLYRVDAADFIVWVDSWWLDFAAENGAADLVEASVLRRSLWAFIEGEETRKLYQAIHDHVRSTGASVVLPFRCDSPTLVRHMKLKITHASSGALNYEGSLLSVEARERFALVDPKQHRKSDFLTMCSCCKRGLLESAGWLEDEELSKKLKLKSRSPPPKLRYSICSQCSAAWK